MIRPRKLKNPHIGSSLDSFLKQEGVYEDVQTTAIKWVLASQLEQVHRPSVLASPGISRTAPNGG
jgi:hypothetical protein